MIVEGLDTYIQSCLDLLPSHTIVYPKDAEQRAGDLLRAVAYLTTLRHICMCDKIKNKAVMDVTYNKVYEQITQEETAKVHSSEKKIKEIGVNEKKAKVEANSEYQLSFEACEMSENHIKYLSTMIEVFNNGHILLRQMAKGIVT